MSAIGTNALLGFIMAITLIFTMGDIDSMLVFPVSNHHIQRAA